MRQAIKMRSNGVLSLRAFIKPQSLHVCFMQEWVIAEKNEVEKKLNIIKQDAALEEMPTVLNAYDNLFKIAHSQIPLVCMFLGYVILHV